MNIVEFWVIGFDDWYLCYGENITSELTSSELYKFNSEEAAKQHIQWSESRDWGYKGMYSNYKPLKIKVTYEEVGS